VGVRGTDKGTLLRPAADPRPDIAPFMGPLCSHHDGPPNEYVPALCCAHLRGYVVNTRVWRNSRGMEMTDGLLDGWASTGKFVSGSHWLVKAGNMNMRESRDEDVREKLHPAVVRPGSSGLAST